MKAIYFECGMGAAGDMLMAALLELCDNAQGFLDRLNAAGIPGAVITAEPSVKCGIAGTRVRVAINGREEGCGHNDHIDHNNNHSHTDGDHTNHNDNHDHPNNHHTHHDAPHHHHNHNTYNSIELLINALNVSTAVKQNALAVYALIAEAESSAHNVPVDKIHFHEVGEMDAVADIVGVCMLIEELSPDVIMASPVNTGSGYVSCAHGVLPVPAPATVRILQNVPIYGGQTVGELCTPTGAAILKHFAKKFGGMPTLSVNKVGYGMGKKDYKKANCVRAYIGETVHVVNDEVNEYVTELSCDLDDAPASPDRGGGNPPPAVVAELSCNLDDMTPEAIAFAQELLLREGALDAWTSPAGMKKGRPGVTFSCLCHSDAKDKMAALIFKHTTTLGIRENTVRRYALLREESELETGYGPVKIKTSRGFGVERSKIEYDDIARIAREAGISIDDALNSIWPRA